MSSIRRVQTERLLQDVVHTLYSTGNEPLFGEVTSRISAYFSNHPAGLPLRLPLKDAIAEGVSSAEEYNKFLAHLAINLDVLYETSLRQIEEAVDLGASLRSHLDRLKKYRNSIETKIDDYLLGLYNAEGYFFTVSDDFSDLNKVDVQMTSAHIDTDANAVVLPSVSNQTDVLSASLISDPLVRVQGALSGSLTHDTLSPFTGALENAPDGMLWAFEVTTPTAEEVIAEAIIEVGNQSDPVHISRIDYNPYGATPVQAFFETAEGGRLSSFESGSWINFGNKIQTSVSKMIFAAESQPANAVKVTLRKTQPDYTQNINGTIYYKYIFGARDLIFTKLVYESSARMVSQPLFIPSDLAGQAVIDAVSIDVKDDIPSGTSLNYFVAASNGEFDEEFSDLDWKRIVPIHSNEEGNKSIRFHGARLNRQRISPSPAAGDLQLLPTVNTGPLNDRNPSPMIIPGVNVHRIAELQNPEGILLNSIRLIEGVNTTRIYSRPLDNRVSFDQIDLEYWSKVFNGPSNPFVDFGTIDSGNGFFYGGDVGADGRDIFVETYLDADENYPTFLEEFQKIDDKSAVWDIQIYLNGRSLGRLQPGVRSRQLPWNLTQGLNHIVVLIRIPSSQQSSLANLFIGTLVLMRNSNLYDYGSVRLGKWSYVDMFTMKYNESDQPFTFTLHKGEIISRRRPTSNFAVEFARDTNASPAAVRVRAELARNRNSADLTPVLDKYRLRFAYGEDFGNA